MNRIELSSLVGTHVISGAFADMVSEPAYDGADYTAEKQVLRFTMDGAHYEAVEDPDDGYRSSLECLRPCGIAPANQFAPIPVVGHMVTAKENSSYKQDILQFLSARSGKPVLEIGTSDCDDYYPGYVAEFHPENA